MTPGQLEILVEPFRENDPGPHVTAVLDALNGYGFEPEMGPFSTTISGELADLLAVLQPVTAAGFEAGATAIQVRLERR